MTNSHAIDREEVMAFLDGELVGDRAAEVEAHVSACEECREMVDSLRQVSGNLKAWAVEPAPLDLAPRLRDTMTGREAARSGSAGSWLRERTRFGLPRWATVAVPAAAVLVLTLVRPLYRSVLPLASHTEHLAYAVPPPPASPAEVATPGSAGASASSGQQGRGSAQPLVAASGPMIARSVSLSIVTDHFPDARAALERISTDMRGMVSVLRMMGDPPARRSLQATLRVPADRLDAALLEVRKLGNVRQESQSSEDVADAHRDLVVRIDNSIKEEARLNELLVNRTGRLQDVLAVEQEVTRVRGQIEQMKAEEIAMRNRVTYATISFEISEAYKAEVTLGAGPQPVGARLRNSTVDGWSAAASTAFGLVLFALEAGPSVLLWVLVIGPPVWWFWRRARRTV